MNKHLMIEALYRAKFEYFVRFALSELRPNDTFLPNWHIDLLIDRLSGIVDGVATRLAINMPPRHLKSVICSLALPAFLAGKDPNKQIMLIVGTDRLAQEFMEKLEKLMAGKRYRSLFPHMRMTWGARSVSFSGGGSIKVIVVGEGLSGRGADLIVIDDPISPSHAKIKKKRDAVNTWYRSEVDSRLNDGRAASILLVMQRVHGEDLCAFVRQNDASFDALVLPAVAVRPETWTLSDGRTITRERGEPLHPERADRNALLRTLDRINGVGFCLQYLQCAYMPRVYAGKEHYHENLWMPRPDGWIAGTPIPHSGDLLILSKEYVLRDVFGFSPPEPVLVTEMPITWDEFNISMIEHQRLLSQEGKPYFGIEDADTVHPLETRKTLFGRDLKAIFKAAHADQDFKPAASG